jgi:hypothetical protein
MLTVMLSPKGRMLRLLPLKVVWRASSLDSLDEKVGAPSTAEAAVQSVRRVWAKCIFCCCMIDQSDRCGIVMEVGMEGMFTILGGSSGVIVCYLYCRWHLGIVA